MLLSAEFEGARETVMWGASQVIGAYEQLAGLIHGEPVSLEGADDEGEGDEAFDEEDTSDDATSNADQENRRRQLPSPGVTLRFTSGPK